MLQTLFIHLLLSYSIFFLKAASFQFFNFLATSCVAFLMKTAPHLHFRNTYVFSHAELDLSIEHLVHQNRILCGSEENDSQYCSVDFSVTSTLQHRSQNLLFLLSLSLSCNGSLRHAFLAFSLKSKLTMRNVRNRGFKHMWAHRTIQCTRVWFSRSQRCYRSLDR